MADMGVGQGEPAWLVRPAQSAVLRKERKINK